MRLRRPLVLSAAAAVATACLSTTAAHADSGPPADPLCTDVSTPVHINLGYFGKSPVVSVADHEGFFARQNVSFTPFTVQGSTDQFTRLESGAFDLIMTASDNVANYRLNTSNALGHTIPVKIVAATDGGYNLQLYTLKDKGSYAALKGGTLGVDADNSGFAFIAYDLLAQNGLAPATKQPDGSYYSPDFKIKEIGGVGGRYFDLTSTMPPLGTPSGKPSDVDATLLSSGFDVLAKDKGYPGLGDVRQVTTPYLSGVVAGTDSYLSAHRCDVVRFDRALEQAARYTTDPANAATVQADIYADEPPFEKSDPTFTAEYYAITVDPVIGQYRYLEIDPKGLYDVLALRKKYDGFDSPQSALLLSTPLGGLYTDQYVLTAEVGTALGH